MSAMDFNDPSVPLLPPVDATVESVVFYTPDEQAPTPTPDPALGAVWLILASSGT